MTSNERLLLVASSIACLASRLLSQGPLNPVLLTKPPTDSWPTYNGDYSGRHYSTLKQIDTTNARALSLAWQFRTTSSTDGAILGGDPAVAATPGRGAGGAGAPPGGAARGADIKAIPLMVDGVLYLSTPGHAYAVDARSGEQIWHYFWRGRGAIGNRGLGMYGGWLYMETGDNRIVSLNAATGEERWHRDMVPPGAGNFSTSAPVIFGNHVIIGVAGDGGSGRGWVESLDPETGDVKWKWMVTPDQDDAALATWPSEDVAAKGSGGVWQQPTYDPQLNLMYITTGQATPTYNGRGRPGTNLYTCSIVALNPDTGKMAWYYQFSPHDTHDWDSTQVPVLIDGTINGQPRKLLAQANRNGYYFLLDRTNGKSLVVKPFIQTANGYKGLDASGVLVPDPAKEPSVGGTLVYPDSDGAANYPAPSFDPDTGLFYVNATNAASIFYVARDAADPTGFGRGSEYHTGLFDSSLLALDYRTGDVKWQHRYAENGFWSSTYPGMLSTAGGLLFTGDPSGNFVAYDARTGKSLWHAPVGATISNTPITFMLDGHQYVIVASKDSLYGFYLQ
jgi:acido-empty-quinoprotein group A